MAQTVEAGWSFFIFDQVLHPYKKQANRTP